LVVDPSVRQRGLARHLDEARLGFVREHDVAALFAFVWRASGAARIKMLEGYGFERTGSEWLEEPPFGLALPMVCRLSST
jgi:ribosomal protein S18 acetylase RimI-like enzyme